MYIRKDLGLTEIAKKIFGKDMIIEAGLFSNNGLTVEYVSSQFDEISFNGKLNEIEIPSDNSIYIKFSNGNIVEFSNSEWASIRKIEVNENNPIIGI